MANIQRRDPDAEPVRIDCLAFAVANLQTSAPAAAVEGAPVSSGAPPVPEFFATTLLDEGVEWTAASETNLSRPSLSECCDPVVPADTCVSWAAADAVKI